MVLKCGRQARHPRTCLLEERDFFVFELEDSGKRAPVKKDLPVLLTVASVEYAPVPVLWKIGPI